MSWRFSRRLAQWPFLVQSLSPFKRWRNHFLLLVTSSVVARSPLVSSLVKLRGSQKKKNIYIYIFCCIKTYMEIYQISIFTNTRDFVPRV